MTTEAQRLREGYEAHGQSCAVPWVPVRIAWYRQAKGQAMEFTHFWEVMPHHRKACTEAAKSRHLFETLFPSFPDEWFVRFDPSQDIPYRHERKTA